MRDLDRWKDKVELSLDGRQIFFLFFGSAVAACLIFVVGVLIGKRIEARALALQPASVEDPLAALDQLGETDEVDEGLTFHKALAPGKAPPTVESRPSAVEKKPAPEPEAEAMAESRPEPPPLVVAKKLPPPPVPPPPTRPQVVQAPAAKKPEPPKKPDAPSGRFTLQLSAFPDKSDAEEFMRKIQAAGYKPFLVASEIPGKGVFYRVRVGDYASRQSAVDAKTEFEKKQRIIAYVAKL